MARKADERLLQLNASNDFIARLDAVAQKLGTTKSSYIRRAVLTQFKADAELIGEGA